MKIEEVFRRIFRPACYGSEKAFDCFREGYVLSNKGDLVFRSKTLCSYFIKCHEALIEEAIRNLKV